MRDYILEKNPEYIDNMIEERYSFDTVENGVFSIFEMYQKFKKFSEKIDFEIYVSTSEYHAKRTNIVFTSFSNKF